jgi:vitamin B12/bleomycin/antimicrobial peptide transport system ATP-binding/permease protein
VSAFAAVIGRLGALWEGTEPSAAGSPSTEPQTRSAGQAVPQNGRTGSIVETVPDAHQLRFEHVTLWTPNDKRPLIRDLSLEVPEGKPIVITGPQDAMRTALLATAGVWHEGEGRIRRPSCRELVFLPRRPIGPIGPASGKLRSILLHGLDRAISEDDLRSTLREVGLIDSIDRHGGLDSECNGSEVLSPAELWALAWARLLLAAPRFALLEAPAADLPTAMGKELYASLARRSITYLTAGCDSAFLSLHDLHLDVGEDGRWRLEPARPEAGSPSTSR